MPIKAITFDAYGTLFRNESLMLIPQRIVADHKLSVRADDVLGQWITLYTEATQRTPFRTLRAIQATILSRLLHDLDVHADALPYVDLFFQVTTKVELYPEVLAVLNRVGLPCAIVSNADHEHVAAWNLPLPVRFTLVSEAAKAYKPHPLIFRQAMRRLDLQPHEVLHVGDSEVDDIRGAQAAGLAAAWVNRDGRSRSPDVPKPDFEIADLTELLTLRPHFSGQAR
jgi:2-haloalkanoic acid dehalogenase type II